MITQLDNQSWSKELVTGNAQFIEVGSTIYVVSQLRADNTFAVFKSEPTPPTPGPGYKFDVTATYLFPTPNTSFDPVVSYDSTAQVLYILGTQNNADGKNYDVILFTYDTATDTLTAPTTLVTASYVRDSFDICALASSVFVAVSVTNPVEIWSTPTVADVTSISIASDSLAVVANNSFSVGQQITFSGLQNAIFLNGVTVTLTGVSPLGFTATYSHSDYTQIGYESGFATWLPGHSLIGFELMVSLSPPLVGLVGITLLDSSPFRSGNTFGAVSVISSDGVSLEVYYEAHPKQITFTDQIFSLNVATRSNGSPPVWVLSTVLTTFTGRYADARLTVIPVGETRTLLQQYYSQLVHDNALVGNLLLGHLDPTLSPPTWAFHTQPGSSTTSYIQGTLSVSYTETSPPVLQAFISYITEPVYDIRGVWSPEVKAYDTDDRLSYNLTPGLDTGWVDYLVNQNVAYAYQGVWTSNRSYNAGDVVKVALPTLPVVYAYYTAKVSISTSVISPNLDVTNWGATPTPNMDSRFTVAPTSWPMKTNFFDVLTFNLTDIPGFYNNHNFSWLRGSKNEMDSGSKWAVVGEISNDTGEGAVYVSDFNVPPKVKLAPSGSTIAYRGTPLAFDASGTSDGDLDSVEFTWTFSPANGNVALTPTLPFGMGASFLVNRSIGGSPQEFIVGVVAVDYNGVTPLHPPMNIIDIGLTSGVVNIVTDAPVSLTIGEQVFVYNLTTAGFLNDLTLTVISVNGSSFSATVNNIPKTELWTIPTTGPYTVTVLNSAEFATDSGVVYAATGTPVTYTHIGGTYTFSSSDAGARVKVSYTYVFSHADYPLYFLTSAASAVSGDTTYTGILPSSSVAAYNAIITGFLNTVNNGSFTVVSNTPTTLVVNNPSGVVEVDTYTLSGVSIAAFEGNTTYAGTSLPAASLVGRVATITGFTNSVNNGAFTVVSNTPTSLVVNNPAGIVEIHSGSVAVSMGLVHVDLATDTGSAIANAQFASCDVSVAPNAAPTIDFIHDGVTGNVVATTTADPDTDLLLAVADRNSLVTITPTYTGVTDADDATVYVWTQTSGTPIPTSQILSGLHKSSLQFNTNGALIQGETLTWSLTVNDSVNSPTTKSIEVVIASYPFDNPDTMRLSRSVWGGTIAQRNTAQSWTPLDVSVIYTDFQSIKRTSVLPTDVGVGAGNDRYILISTGSVCVYGGSNPIMVLIRKLFPPINTLLSPPMSYPVIDAVHTEDDWTLLLDGSGTLYRYSSAPLINTDNPDNLSSPIILSTITAQTFNKIFTTFSYANTRVIILTGPDGCLLLQLNNTSLAVQGFLELSVESGMLYGVDNVQFVRASNVESLSSGKLLLGTIVQVTANITSTSITGNALTVVANNSFAAGDVVTFANLTQATFLNGVKASVVSATPSQFVISYQRGDYTALTEGTGATATTGGKTYETLIDLSHGQIIGTWDASKLRNQFVTTGEILFETNDTYSGRPGAPVLNDIPIPVSSTPGYVTVTVSWTADRPDLIQSYVLESAFDNQFSSLFTSNTIGSGYIQSTSITVPTSYVLYFRVKAHSVDGDSPYSNIKRVNT